MDIWEICELMIKSVQNRLKDKGINLIVDMSVQAFLTDEGYDPIYGARPLRRAIMKYLEDTLAEQCLSKTLYPNTKIYVRRKKVEGTLMTYTNELEVEIDFTDVDPSLLENATEEDSLALVAQTTARSEQIDNSEKSNKDIFNSDLNDSSFGSGNQSVTSTIAGKASKFFKKKVK